MEQYQPRFAIVGAGSIGLATAVDLARQGYHQVALYDCEADAVAPLATGQAIGYDGLWGAGQAAVAQATTEPAAIVPDADVVLVSTTADAHAQVAADLAPLLRDGQVVLLHQGYVGGALHFAQQLRQAGSTADLRLGETMNALYLCARPAPGKVFIKGQKAWLEVAAYPAHDTAALVAQLSPFFPQVTPGENSLATGLNNPNPMVHPAAYLLNLGLLELTHLPLGQGALHFDELMSQPIQVVSERLEQERQALMDALRLPCVSRAEFSRRSYPPGAVMRQDFPRFGPKLLPRFIYEDIPTGLVPIADLATLAGVATPVTRLLIDLAALTAHYDFWEHGRTLARFGLQGQSVPEIVTTFAGS